MWWRRKEVHVCDHRACTTESENLRSTVTTYRDMVDSLQRARTNHKCNTHDVIALQARTIANLQRLKSQPDLSAVRASLAHLTKLVEDMEP